MSTTRLPKLPLAVGYEYLHGGGWRAERYWNGMRSTKSRAVFSDDDVHAYGLAVWKAAIQCAVERIERMKRGENTDYSAGYDDACDDIIAALAALPLPEQGSPQERREG